MDVTMKKTYLAVILIQAIYAGMYLLSKAAFDGGMNNFIFIFYRQTTATVVLVPLSIFLDWKNAPRLTFVTFCKIFILSFFGITLSLNINGIALVYTSATLAAATTNCLPVITFFLAVVLGVEVLKLRTKQGAVKLMGMVMCIVGAACLAFLKGPHFRLSLWNFGQSHSVDYHPHHIPSSRTWVKGCFLMLLSNFFWSLWLVFQVQVLKSYPSKLLFTSLQCFLSSIQSFGIAIAFERRSSEWKLGLDLRLIAVAYCGIVVTGVTYYLQAWVIEKKGPVFLAMWTPLALIITMFTSAIFMCEVITLASVLGGGLLILGLYSVLWGKSKEHQITDKLCLPADQKSTISELKEIKITKATTTSN